MTPLGLTVLRRTATLVHAVPGLRVRLRHDGNALLEVLRPAHPVVAPPGRWITPCSFRLAVGRAVGASLDGRTPAVLGLEPGVDPAVELGVTGGRLLAGGIALVPTTSGCDVAFATTVAVSAVTALADGLALDLRCHPDPITEAALLVHTTRARADSPTFGDELQRVQALLARCAVRELVDDRDAFLHTIHSRDRPPRS